MKKILSAFLFSVILLTSCSNQNNYLETQNGMLKYSVYDWNSIKYNDKTFKNRDKYGNAFKNYYIFDELSDKAVSAIYYSDGQESGKVKLKPYVGNTQTNFISQVKHWYDLFEPSVYGNIDNPRFDYLDVYDNVDKMSLLFTSNDSATYQNGEYILSDKLSNEIWSNLNKMEKNISNDSNSKFKKTNLNAWIYLYIKDVNAAVYVGILCYDENDELCVSNTNYTELYPLSSKWQNLNNLLGDCNYVENSLLLNTKSNQGTVL